MTKEIIIPKNPSRVVEIPTLSWCGGSHVALEDDLYKTVLEAVKAGLNCFQFFLGDPTSYTRRKCDYEDISRAKKLADLWGLAVFSHAPYRYNLNGSVKQLCWAGDKVQDAQARTMIKNLEYELSVLSNFSHNGVVVHPGSYKDREAGIEKIAETINRIKFPKNSMLLLENCAGEGNKIPRNFGEIKEILSRVERNGHVGVCLDTAHIHGVGEYDLSDPGEVARMFSEFKAIVGLDRLKLVHLNDSRVKLGSKKDAHYLIGHGEIWGEDVSGLLYLLNFCRHEGIPTVLETDPGDMDTLFGYDRNNLQF